MSTPESDPCLNNFAEHSRHLFVDVAQAGAIATGARPARRAVFRKTHGVVHAKMSLDSIRPAFLRHGIFASDSYDVWIRFSSDVAPNEADVNNGTMGVALKLFGAIEPTLADVDPAAPTADLLLQNHDVFFVDTGSDMCTFTDLALKGRLQEWLDTHARTREVLDEMQKREESVLTAIYWSVLPYACGPVPAVKYRLSPRASGPSLAPDSDPNRLRSDMTLRLRSSASSFIFSIQVPREGMALPTDQATVRWDEADAPFFEVGTVDVPAQDVGTEGQEIYGDTLAFSPWRVPIENRPLGSIAESRRKAYPASAALRHHVNGSPDGEPHTPRKP